MTHRTPTRREVLRIAGAAALAPFGATRVLAQAPPAVSITPELVDAARKEGAVNFYTAMELSVAQSQAKAFEGRYPGIRVRVERSGSERIFQRIGQEYGARIFNVDFVNSADAAHALVWKTQGWLAPFVPEDVARHWPAVNRDPDGAWLTHRVILSVMGYNTQQVTAAEAPKSYKDLLDPKWAGRIVKAHPGYSGTALTATFQLARDLGWGFFEALAKQRVMQVQSSVDPPKKIALGERAVMMDGGDYLVYTHKEKGDPVEIIYPAEGSPTVGCPSAIFKTSPNPSAGRLFMLWSMSAEGQQALVDFSGQYSLHPAVKPKAGRPPLSAIKTLREDPAAVARDADEIKAKYLQYFKV